MPRKLKLDVEKLTVSSFETGASIDGRGTVEAREGKVPCAWSVVLNSCVFTARTCASVEFSCLEG